MTCTQEEFKETILQFAKLFDLYNKYSFYIKSNELALTEIVKRLGYDLFIRAFCYHDATHREKKLYNIILKYNNEIEKNKVVEFK